MVPGYGKSPEDEDTAGWAAVEWGEHELDYVLLLQMTEEQEKRFTVGLRICNVWFRYTAGCPKSISLIGIVDGTQP